MIASTRFAGLALLLLTSTFAVGLAQDDKKKDKDETPAKNDAPPEDKRVYRNVTPEKLENVLKEMKVTYQKVKGKEEGVWFYDFEKNNFKIRLHDYQGKDLWIDAHFTEKLTLEQVNGWNVRAKFSRAVQLKKDKDTVSLEAQLDCLGGVTDAIIRQFVDRFDGELVQFSKYLTK